MREAFTIDPTPELVARGVSRKRGRYFFVVMSFSFLIIALAGFIPSYQDMYSGTRPIHWFAHIHGALMTAWLLVFIAQTALSARGLLSCHRQLGLCSLPLGALVWISMGIASARALIGYQPPIGHFLFDVLIIQLYGMLLFGFFFTWGVIVRKNAHAHKRMLFFATLVLIQAAIDRIRWLPRLHDALFVRFLYLDAFLIALIAYDLFTIRYIHRITLTGTLVTILTQCAVVMLWGASSWHRFWFDLIDAVVK